MKLEIVMLVVLSAILHSAWNTILKKQKDTQASSVAFALLACIFAFLLGAKEVESLFNLQIAALTFAAGLFAGGALWAQGHSYTSGYLGLSYTITRAGYLLLLWPCAHILLGEQIDINDVIGVTLLIVSLSLIMLDGKKLKVDNSLLWASAAAVFIVGYSLAYKASIKLGGHPLAVLFSSDIIRVAFAYIMIKNNRQSRFSNAFNLKDKYLWLMALCSFGSFSIFLYALKFEGAAHLGSIRNLSIVFTMIGGSLIGEKLSLKQYILIIVSMIGTVLIGA